MSVTINLSDESINIIMAALKDSQIDLKNQIRDYAGNPNKADRVEIAKHQLKEVNDVIAIFEEHGF